jgi:glycerophosphoryl diester phosphodiesterase
LDQAGADPETPIVIQSFSAASLRVLRHDLGTGLPLALLIGGGDGGEWLTPEGLSNAAEFATGIGPTKSLLLDAPGIIDLAHERGLTVVPWTFRADDSGDFATAQDEMAYYLNDLGVDGLIANNPDLFPRTPGGGP